MRGARLRLLLPLVAAAGLLLALLPRIGGGADDPIPTYRVTQRDFERRVRADGNLRAVKATPLSIQTPLQTPFRIAWLALDGSRVEAGDPVVRFDPTDAEKQMEDARDELAKSELKIEKEKKETGTEITNLERDTSLAALELESARRFQKRDELVYSRHDILESEMDSELAEKKMSHAEHAETTRADLAQTELQILGIERRRARQKIDQAGSELAALELTAPHDGIVVFQRDYRGNLPQVGDTVFRRNILAEIPDLSAMEVEVYVLEADAGGLEQGKPATVTLDAHPGIPFEAEVARVDALAKPRQRGSPVQYFAATLRLAVTDPELMKPGQRVRAELLLERQEDVLVIPRQGVFERDGGKVVYRRGGDGFEAVPVTLGAVGLGSVVVVDGLEEGDVIALADPGHLNGPPEDGGDGASPVVKGLEEPRL